MMNVIKTAIITIVISIISGLLLEYFKNVAPRILCNIGKGVAMEINNKKVYAYSITVSNLSQKTIHDLTLNIQSSQSNLNMADAKITKGLKFDSLIKDDSVEVDIPFLSKGDKFSVTVYVENKYGVCSQPTIVLRSPENFKQVNSIEKTRILSLFNTDDTDKTDRINKNNKSSRNKKVIISIVSIIVFMIAGGLLKLCFERISTDSKQPSVKTDTNEKFNNDTRSSENGTNKNTDIKTPTRRKNKNIDRNTNTLKEEPTKNTGTKKSTEEPTKNTDVKAPTNKIDESTDAKTKASKGEAIKNKDEGNKNSDIKTSKSKEGTNENSNEKQVKDGLNGNEGK
ncbi:hypothetical protein IRP63_10635 [Clostridium botulinum]|uniref:Membrane protein n=1 Tax=Clostridium botulinum C/D str. DC5 TaxID=1443128 RepID=A0A0A0IF38_CLOBO|nr:hypothetical protein [Clostridium botulinum]KEI04181.1 membrane protein [Clostridium botulinum C/D str. BKT75002]KEI11546.1 membrane protein [Clostridium botulinum C/D str. BKT2873]KGM94427.1 membrane protein [Clostridium botulinum D str. CCUG 7971]KGM98901.1 membrane protein [Clostridium botulinum C/D str. DC5]KOC50085.1 hypothetical protein ADU88_03895 [Clostridium botulinum]